MEVVERLCKLGHGARDVGCGVVNLLEGQDEEEDDDPGKEIEAGMPSRHKSYIDQYLDQIHTSEAVQRWLQGQLKIAEAIEIEVVAAPVRHAIEAAHVLAPDVVTRKMVERSDSVFETLVELGGAGAAALLTFGMLKHLLGHVKHPVAQGAAAALLVLPHLLDLEWEQMWSGAWSMMYSEQGFG